MRFDPAVRAGGRAHGLVHLSKPTAQSNTPPAVERIWLVVQLGSLLSEDGTP